MNEEQIKQKILEFLKNNELAVVATMHADKDGLESALVGFANTESLEIIFGTSNKSRKYANLQKNHNIALVIGFSSQTGTLQYEGVAQELTEEAEEYRQLLIQKNESNKISIAKEDHRLFKVRPTWIRFLDIGSKPPGKYELNF